MWDPACACFAAGTAEDGVTRNPTLALDAQIWPLTALPGAAGKFASAVTTAEQRMSVGGSFSYGEERDGVWTEGTARSWSPCGSRSEEFDERPEEITHHPGR